MTSQTALDLMQTMNNILTFFMNQGDSEPYFSIFEGHSEDVTGRYATFRLVENKLEKVMIIALKILGIDPDKENVANILIDVIDKTVG